MAVQSARKSLSRPEQLVAAGLLNRERLAEVMQVAERYALALTPDIVELIDDLHGPIARQFVPTKAELQLFPEETSDPIGDEQHSPVPGIVHRYPDRVLLTPGYVCAAYCRFCFRREVVGRQRALSPAQLRAALKYIRNHQGIWEVILSGGDPLVLSVRRLAEIMRALAAIDHVRVIRVHTRVPVAAPGRVRPELVRALQSSGKATFVVLHANHAKELTRNARTACARLVDAGLPMLSQTVLLRGVNDDADTLGELMRVLVENRIKPYYLHHPDLAPGTAHWRTDIAHGQSLMRALRGRLSGLCQPNYVLDIPGGHGKSPIGPTYIASIGEWNGTARYEIEDYNGKRHLYPLRPGSSSPTNGVQGSQVARRRRGPA
jgi:lysine 2,3-aminomutase